jgi:hypothetical protein
MQGSNLFTAPWPGPGNSEGPVDPELPVPSTADRQFEAGKARGSGAHLPVMTDAWPGPGDSEGPVEIDAEEPLASLKQLTGGLQLRA